MNYRRLLSIAATMLVAGCASGMKVSQDWDQGADFTGYQTFGWMQETEARPQSQQLLESRVKQAVESELTAKGLRKASSNPDLLVAWDAKTETQQSATTYGTAYGGGYRGRYGGGFATGTSTTTINEWQQGTLIIDLNDAKANKLVYHGSAQAKLNQDASPDQRTQDINNAVAKILEKYPAGG